MTQPLAFDILVIGGGPAGIVAALNAANGSASPTVCLVDRKKEPGFPVRCGEAIGLKGFSSCVDIDKSWIKCIINKARLVSPRGIGITLPGNFDNYIIDREKMERDLVAQAQGKGAEFVPDTTIVTVSRNSEGCYECRSSSGKTFKASCLILADGVESKLARGLGWKTCLQTSDVISCAFARMNHDNIEQDACTFFMGRSIAPGGYAWVFPRGEKTANVGLGVLGPFCRRGMPKELLLRFIQTRFPGAEVSPMHCGGVPMGTWLKPLVKDGVMIVGDAARQVNCTSGAGLAYSFFSGKAAGIAAREAFVKAPRGATFDDKLLKNYQRQWASYYGKQQKRSHALKKTMTGFTDSFLDDVARSLQKIEPGALTVSKVFIKAFARHPLQLLKIIKLFG
jgi:digeranylgeranylglycerophospholipid reductase